MFNNNQPSSTNNWPSTVKYQSYTPDQRSKIIWLLVLATVSITLSVAALIIVFAVEHSWFHDSFNITTPNVNDTSLNQYGLWRLCFSPSSLFPNSTCGSWFSIDSSYSSNIEKRLDQAKVGINAWQALEIVFLFLTTSSLIIALISIICYGFRKSIHYYLAILAVFCIWPAACVGISALFVFGFSVFDVAPMPRGLDWCFYVNLAAVILSIIGAILLTIYDILLKKPIKTVENDTVIDIFSDINDYPTQFNPSTSVGVKRNKKKRKKPYDYPEMFYPTRPVNNVSNTDYIPNPNHQMLAPYPSVINNQQINPAIQQQQQQQQQQPQHQSSILYRSPGLLTSPSTTSIPAQPWYYQPPISSYPYEPPHWHRTGTTLMNYNHESTNDYVQRGIYRPTRLNPTERTFEQKEEPRVLHYYTGYNHFSVIDPRDAALTRQHPSLHESNSPVRYTVNPSYYQQKGY
ncbi:unnamed protein product [Rotaria sordida]|uniref:Uncharacterized protein n=1 Tax=Rotaria sordida TaxID=392033 RepID=A0A819G6B7_9BILA|nr:unnamed protein product [Rotaria sordida]CAF3876955.1 unnamed protein product [Rotaria sordida]